MDRQEKRKIILALVRLFVNVLACQVDSMLKYKEKHKCHVQDKKPFDKSKHPQGEDGRFVYKTGTVGEGKGAVEARLGFGSDKPEFTAETTSKGHDEHHERHAAEMGLNLRQWKQEAADLLNAEACGNFYDWSIPAVEKFFRYDVTTSRLAVGDRNGNIKTYFILSKSARNKVLPLSRTILIW